MASKKQSSRMSMITSLVFSLLLFPVIGASSQPPAHFSPSAENDMICPADNAEECYPKLFQPTEDFQVVRDDQHLPPGLHVRLDIYSGKKEARLNTPTKDEPALEGMPVEQAVIVVEPNASDDEEERRIPSGAPPFEAMGKAKVPKEENPAFSAAMDGLKSQAATAPATNGHALDNFLVDLEELSHDMYYGQEITLDREAVKDLFCLLTGRDLSAIEHRQYAQRRDFLASSILSSAVQNNPQALRNLEANWESVMDSRCGSGQAPLKDYVFAHLEPRAHPGSQQSSEEASWIRTHLPVVGGLLKSDKIRSQFMADDGMRNLLQILLSDGPSWDAPRARVARIVSDTFLDESVGAKMGVWPLGPVRDGDVCNTDSKKLDEGCWEYHLEKIRTESPDDHWSQDLLARLQEQRSKASRGQATREREL